ncbi:MAG TPA: hypothetical protein PKY59_12305 [Pyrinomonadaceae bacterium]|nr:hypothetical protein [Pyrinomonadaceae bacterium]
MKIKLISTVGVASLAMIFSACSASISTNTTNTAANANKPANAATNATNTAAPANAANTNTAANTTAAAPAADGDTVKIDEAGVMMVIPKGFKHSKDGEDIIVQTEDGGVDIRFTVPKDGDYEKAITDAAQEIDDYLKDVKIEDKGSDVTVDGMKAVQMSGTATNEGEPVVWNLTIINGPKKPVLANIYAEKTSLEKDMAKVKAFLGSVKKM